MANAERRASLSLDQTTSSAENTIKVKPDKKTKPTIEETKPIEIKETKEIPVKEVKDVKACDQEETDQVDLPSKEMTDELSEISPSDDTQEVDGEGFKAAEALLNMISLTSLKTL